MPGEGDEISSEIHVKKLVSEDTAANLEESPDKESSERIKNDKNEKQKGQNRGTESSETEEQSSPRGVLEIPISGSDSVNGSTTDRSSSFVSEKSSGVSGELSFGNIHWNKLFSQIKKGSLKKFPIISLLGGHGYGLGFDLTRKKMTRKKIGSKIGEEDAIDSADFVMPKPSWRNFSYEELKQATENFSPAKLIGKGGHAEVYRGCLSEGQVVAVKKIIKEKKKDEERVGDFLSELGILAHIDHTNAAKLVGFSVDNGLYLVLHFSPHGSLATVLHGSEECLEWKTRCKVAFGVAEGLQYLHFNCQRRIIHRDITASNILLSEDYEAQISDFGLAKWLPENLVHHVVSPIEGTFGYMAPEYFMHGIIHEKTDVFAFGVMLLELITGRRAVDSCRQSLVMWAKPHLEKNNIKELVDPRIGSDYDITEMKRAMFVASTCIHHSPTIRPNMKQVVHLLRGDNETEEMKQKSMGGRALLVDACDLEDYTCTTYLKDLNRHMELVME
ncbi:hypothetical protein F511_23211 [Dorcoceras hygrometricum]|uniref:non-specific serine/threonine protein kinase n=1 Tax=Dorcoceras hygrometricum TaxID=472368 RepID=A0A2Z7A9U9_9LAMI|nr:hypothetical protein F511_23211 [Dorcoceras hygrometricum]